VKLSLSTNWCSRLFGSGEAVAEKAAELGFDELELGYALTEKQAEGIRRRLDLIRAGSVHAFCPVPVSAPHSHPELYHLADFDAETRGLAAAHIVRCIEFAAGIGADTLVLHAGRVGFNGIFDRLDSGKLKDILVRDGGNSRSPGYMKALSLACKRRQRRGRAVYERFRETLDGLLPVLERNRVVLAMENMPYLEGFPDENEMRSLLKDYAGAPVKAWFDTGHHHIRVNHSWTRGIMPFNAAETAGIHLNDVRDLDDDHLAPGEGGVDFAALAKVAAGVPHLVLEPDPTVPENDLVRSAAFIRRLFGESSCR
jgi:sugar phosphate isomerase/epimerase